MEAKLDAILLAVDPNGERAIKKIDKSYEARHTDTELARLPAERQERA